MDYRYSTKGNNHLRLSARRKKLGFKRACFTKSESSSSSNNNGANSSMTEKVNVSLPSTSSTKENVSDIQMDPLSLSSDTTIDSNSNSVSNNTGRKRKRKLTSSIKRKKRIVNSGLLKWNMEKNIQKASININHTKGDISNDDIEAHRRQNQADISVYEFEDSPLEKRDDQGKKLFSADPAIVMGYDYCESCNGSGSGKCTCTVEHLDDVDIEVGYHNPGRDNAISSISGRFIVDGQHFLRAIRELEIHRSTCINSIKGYFRLKSSTTHALTWVLKFECPYCKEKRTVTSEPIVETSCKVSDSDKNPVIANGEKKLLNTLNISDCAVWGFMSIGGGHSNMEEVFSSMGIKTIDQKTFQRIETKLGKVWKEILFDSMLEVGRKERRLAVENGNVTADGTPFITVIVDGGWAFRSHGHRYDANSGVTCVIGSQTKGLLDMDIRNKYCAMCVYLQKNNKSEVPHTCSKNWEGTSAAMEPDMLVEAFRRSKELHGVEYRCFIGDGDSSVHKRLQENVPYGRHIKKIECTNHAVKNYTKALMKSHGVSLIVRKVLTKPTVKRLVCGARAAIIHNSKNGQDVAKLKEDLKNGPYHVFGIHTHCKAYFCKHITSEAGENDTASTLIDDKTRQTILYVLECLKPLLRKAPQLVTNSTSNNAENFMSLVAKFIGGKQVNRSKRSSYGIRAHGAGLNFQFGPLWHYKTMRTALGRSPIATVKRRGYVRLKKRISTRRSLFGKNTNRRQKHADIKGKEDYGEMCHKLDMDVEDVEREGDEFISSLQVSVNKRNEIEQKTRGQSDNDLWFEERKNRITASIFGKVAKRKATSKWAKLVDWFLYAKGFTNDAVEYGKVNEANAINAYTAKTGQTVSPCGLFVDLDNGFLGASPDGLLGDNGIIEVKCPKKAENMTISEAITRIKAFCLSKTGTLKRSHDYYYQIQGQLHVAKKDFCDFVIWTPKDIYIERIYPDFNFWSTKVLPKLIFFYKKAVVPEIIDPRKCRSMAIREPEPI